MADVRLTESCEQFVAALSPEDQADVAWAFGLLEDDDTRQHRSRDLVLAEQGYAVWAFVAGNMFLAFVESGVDEVTIVHVSFLSRFGYLGHRGS